MLTTTLHQLKLAGACTGRYRHLCKALGGIKKYGYDTPIPLDVLLEKNGLEDTFWAIEKAISNKQHRDFVFRIFAVKCACSCVDLYEKQYPWDRRVRFAIETAALFAYGLVDENELHVARVAANAAAWDAARAARSESSSLDAYAAASSARTAAWSTIDFVKYTRRAVFTIEHSQMLESILRDGLPEELQ